MVWTGADEEDGGGAEVLVRVVDLEPPPGATSGEDVWTSAGLAERLGSVATVSLD